MPPPSQQGHSSYVWIPDVSDAEDNAAVNDEQLDVENLVDNMVMEDNDGSVQTEEDYVDPYAAEIEDFPGVMMLMMLALVKTMPQRMWRK
jgi:hypothetical protein